MFTLAHLFDSFEPDAARQAPRAASKRMLGYVNWHRGRKYVHRREILDLITGDIVEQKPDHIAVTGDLVNLGLPEEFLRATEWLHHLGPPSKVTAIPGNHDAYVRLHPKAGTHHWRPFMESNPAGEKLFPTPNACFPQRMQKARAMLADPRHDRLRISELAYACGFNEVSYFNRCFRRRFGASPTQFRS